MKKLLGGVAVIALLAGAPALAADMAVKAPVYKAPPPPAPVFSWTGCYVGGHAGGGWGRTDWTDRQPGSTGPNFFFVGGTSNSASLRENESGWVAGGQLGCDYQVNNWVFGIEGSAAGTGIKGDMSDPFFSNKTLHAQTDWLASVTPRIGYAWDRLLVYARGGVAWSHNEYVGMDHVDHRTFNQSDTPTGWTVGGGIEYAFAPGWSGFVEYMHYDFGTTNLLLTTPSLPNYLPVVGFTQRIDAVTAGINVRFNTFLR